MKLKDLVCEIEINEIHAFADKLTKFLIIEEYLLNSKLNESLEDLFEKMDIAQACKFKSGTLVVNNNTSEDLLKVLANRIINKETGIKGKVDPDNLADQNFCLSSILSHLAGGASGTECPDYSEETKKSFSAGVSSSAKNIVSTVNTVVTQVINDIKAGKIKTAEAFKQILNTVNSPTMKSLIDGSTAV